MKTKKIGDFIVIFVMANPRLLKSQKNKPVLIHDDFLYQRHSANKVNTVIYWRCHNRGSCDARCSTTANLENIQIKTSGSRKHTHAPDVASVAVRTFLSQLKEYATNAPNEGASNIVRDHVATIDNEEVLAMMPERNDLRRTVNRVQNKTRPPLPKRINDIEIPRRYRRTKTGQRFLMHDSGADDPNRILIFTTVANMQKLAASIIMFSDGTFKIVPHQFLQLMTIHGIYKGFCFPFVYVLTVNRTEETYSNVYTELKAFAVRHNLNLNPPHLMSDFEIANINACREAFPQAQIHSCLFHFEQSMFKNIQKLELVQYYRDLENPEIRNSLLQFMALPFVPLDEILTVFNELKDDAPDEVEDFVQYLERTYVKGRPARGRRRAVPPRFPPKTWCVYDLVLNQLHRTNNVVESYHSKYQKMVKSHHLNIWKFIEYMQKDQRDTEQLCQQLDLGHTRIKQQISKKSKRNQERILRRVQRYQEFKDEDDIPRYLRGIAYYIRVSNEPEDENNEESDQE